MQRLQPARHRDRVPHNFSIGRGVDPARLEAI
jgi:hypothetical protein